MKKKLVSLLLALSVVTAALLSGCSSSNNAGSETNSTDQNSEKKEDSKAQSKNAEVEESSNVSALKDGEMTEIKVVFPAGNASPPELQEVEDAINEVVQQTIDAKITLNIIEWGAYTDQINLMISSGEKLDLFFAYSNIKNMANRGQLLPITELVDTYAKESKEIMSDYMDACYFGEDVYGMPTYRDLANQGGLVCRKDILEETGIKAEDIKTWDDVEQLLIKVKELYPDMYGLIPADLKRGSLTNYNKGVFDFSPYGVGAYIDDNDGHIDIVNIYDTEEYKELAQKAYDWNEKGYFMPDPTTTTSIRSDLIGSDSAFGYYGNVHPGTVTQETMNSGNEMVAIPMSTRILTTEGVNFCQWVLPTQCESPEKTMAFLNLLYTNADIQNLFRFGIEGKDYVMKDEANQVVGYPEGVDSSTVGWGIEMWLSGNASIGYVWETDPVNIWDEYTEFNDTAVKSPLYGFVYDSSNVQNEITAITNVTEKYTSIIEAGLTDPLSTIEKLNQELKAAGIQNIIDDMQQQVDEWSSQN